MPDSIPAPSGGDNAPRRAVSRRLRFEILRRDNHACRYCGGAAPAVKLTVDHVMPVALGGTSEPTNLVTACADCNSGKSSASPDAPIVADVASDALRWAAAIKVAAEQASAKVREDARLMDTFQEMWEMWEFGAAPWNQKPAPIPDDWQQSIAQFTAAGLTPTLLADAVNITMASNAGIYHKWRYFCGVCWKKVSRLQDEAAATVAGGA